MASSNNVFLTKLILPMETGLSGACAFANRYCTRALRISSLERLLAHFGSFGGCLTSKTCNIHRYSQVKSRMAKKTPHWAWFMTKGVVDTLPNLLGDGSFCHGVPSIFRRCHLYSFWILRTKIMMSLLASIIDVKLWVLLRFATHLLLLIMGQSVTCLVKASFLASGTVMNWWCWEAYVPLPSPKTNIAPEHGPSQKETSIPTIHFQGIC